MNKKKIKNAEWKILIYVTLLLIIGLVALYSASTSNENLEFKKQIMWLAIGIPILFFVFFIDYKIIARFSIIFYIVSIGLLGLVLLTTEVNGASSWFNIGSFSMQPAEFAKIGVILFLASTISKFRIRPRKKNKQTIKFNKNNKYSIFATDINSNATRLWYSYGLYICTNIYFICCRDR